MMEIPKPTVFECPTGAGALELPTRYISLPKVSLYTTLSARHHRLITSTDKCLQLASHADLPAIPEGFKPVSYRFEQVSHSSQAHVAGSKA